MLWTWMQLSREGVNVFFFKEVVGLRPGHSRILGNQVGEGGIAKENKKGL